MQRKETIQLSITGVLLAVLVIFTAQLFSGKKQAGLRAAQKNGPRKKALERGLYSRLEEETKDLAPARNPFTNQKRGTFVGSSLEGIVWDPENPKAIINGAIVGVGDKIKDYTIIHIKRDGVILRDEARNVELELGLFK